jgi:hypothetical protein
MADSGDSTTYVFSVAAVRRGIKSLVRIPIHEHFAGYLAILMALRKDGTLQCKPAEITVFHNAYLKIEGDPNAPFALRRDGERFDQLDTFAYPAHNIDGHRIPERLIARSVSRELAPIRDQCVVVGEALQAFAFDRHETANADIVDDRI